MGIAMMAHGADKLSLLARACARGERTGSTEPCRSAFCRSPLAGAEPWHTTGLYMHLISGHFDSNGTLALSVASWVCGASDFADVSQVGAGPLASLVGVCLCRSRMQRWRLANV